MKRNSAVSMRDIIFSLTALLTFGTLPAAVVLSPSVAVFKRNLAKLTFSSFYVTVNNMCLCVFTYFMLCILYCSVSGRLVLLLLIN